MERIEAESLKFSAEFKQLQTDEEKYEFVENYLTKTMNFADPLLFDAGGNAEWLNCKSLKDEELRGKLVLVDFFTYCCINCIHMFPFVHRIETEHSVRDGLVVVGVHSAKFPTEKKTANIGLFLKQYDIKHPVINDANCEIWNKMSIKCWPTFLVVSPDGRVLLSLPGEAHCEPIKMLIDVSMEYFKRTKSLTDLSIDYVEPVSVERTKNILNFPSKLAISPSGSLIAISCPGNNKIIICKLPTFDVVQIVGNGAGFADGNFNQCRFNSPQGLTFLNETVLYVADTGNHLVRQVNIDERNVETLIGKAGVMGLDKIGGKKSTEQEINSPWDLQLCSVTEEGDSNILLIAMAGSHQIWAYFLSDVSGWLKGNYEAGTCSRLVGSGNEENRNNSYRHKVGLAQPSGLAFDGRKYLYVADSESSTVRRIDFGGGGGCNLVVGGGFDPLDLFSYGDEEGVGRNCKLQHPMDVAWCEGRKAMFVADTFNNKLKLVDPTKKVGRNLSNPHQIVANEHFAQFGISSQIQKLELDHPSGICLHGDDLYVADSNNHRVVKLDLTTGFSQDVRLSTDQVTSQLNIEQLKLFDGKSNKRVMCDAVTMRSDGREEVKMEFLLKYENCGQLASDSPSKFQIGKEKNGTYFKIDSGKISGNRFDISFKCEDNCDLIFESVLFTCNDGLCMRSEFTHQIPLNIIKNENVTSNNDDYIIEIVY